MAEVYHPKACEKGWSQWAPRRSASRLPWDYYYYYMITFLHY